MLTENKFSKYLIYAIGEIILVVIGILIALQINNWNSNRLDAKKTKIVLQSIRADIIKDTLEIEKLFDGATTEVKFVKNIQERVHSNKATLDTIIKIAKFEFSYYVGWPTRLH